MEEDKLHNGAVTVTIEGEGTIEFMTHSFYEILEAFMEKGF